MIDQAHSSYRVYRQTGIGHGVANPSGDTTAAALQAAWPMTAAQWKVTPAIGALYQHQSLDAFGETVPSSNPLASAFAVQGARSTYDTMIEVWVDPQRNHLPVHAKQRSGNDEFDLLLESMAHFLVTPVGTTKAWSCSL